MMELETYHRYSREDLGLSREEWEDLVEYVFSIREPIRQFLNSQGAEGVEEDPPRITSSGEFYPGGWVGTYPGNIIVVPDRIPRSEYETMLRDLVGWVETLGINSVNAILPFSPDTVIDIQSLLQRYSEYLVEYTEIVMAQRIPAKVERSRKRGQYLRGRPDFRSTLKEESKGSTKIVSRRTLFSLDSLPNLLLIKFHAEMANQLYRLVSEYEFEGQSLYNQLRYHQEFLRQDLPSKLLNQSLETQFTDPGILEKTRSQASGDLQEILDLWEGYQRELSFDIQLIDRFTTAVKPASKVYELWVLSKIIDVISRSLDKQPITEDLSSVFKWDDGVSLYYNRSVSALSKHLGPKFRPRPGRPDFLLEMNGGVMWVGDAKFKHKENLNTGDYQRFLSYIVDYISADHGKDCAILYLDGSQGPVDIEGREMNHWQARPTTLDTISDYFQELIYNHSR